MNKIIIAVDGFSSSGKSTMARTLASAIGYIYIDTGAMYRAVTLFAMEAGLISADGVKLERLEEILPNCAISFHFNETKKRNETWLNGVMVEDVIRGLEVAQHVSVVSAIGFVRKRMVELQQEMGKEKGVVMDGRDIGTAVFPNAELKFFVTAPPEIRAQRRYDELKQKGEDISFEEVLENIKQRDYLDQNRDISPLRQASDAYVLDNGNMNLQEQEAWVMKKYNEVISCS